MTKKKDSRASKKVATQNPYFKSEEDKLAERKEKLAEIIIKKLGIKAKTPNQKLLQKSIREKMVTICKGRAGTGKTFLALAEAIDLLVDNTNPYATIYIFKSAKTLREEEVGFMPGTYEEKMALPLLSYTLNLKNLLDEEQIAKLIVGKYIEMIPLGYARGLSLKNAIVILDEAQNVSVDNLRTLMTRFADTSKLIIMGDEQQNDNKKATETGLPFLVEHFRDADEKIQVVELGLEDVQRNELIKKIDKIFEDELAKKNSK